MKIEQRKNSFISQMDKIEYPLTSIIICLMMIYLSPFVSLYLNYLAFAVCLYRIVRYDESVFAIDYCVLAGVSYIFLSTEKVSLLAWLSIIFAIYHIIRKGATGNTAFILLLFLFDYMLLRMGSALNNFVLCFSQLLLLYVLLSTQRKNNIVFEVLAFCTNNIISSIYALMFRNEVSLRSILGEELPAYWGSSLVRFQGLFRDPNYYMTMILISIALLVVLYMNQYITRRLFFLCVSLLIVFGALTYSKTFIIVLAIFIILFIFRQFRSGHYLICAGSILLVAGVMLLLSDTLFAVTLYRITSSGNLYELTTGRSELLINYFEVITDSVKVFFWGEGLSADILRRGTHNLFLEIVYFLGITGLFLMFAYCISLVKMIEKRFDVEKMNPNGFFRYIVLVIFVLLFCTLQGMTFVITYVMLYLAILATEIFPNDKASGK